jgi:ferritin-like metal-binding protein YciE
MAELRNLEDLFKHELMELYRVEENLIQAIPEMVSRANDQLLKMALENHLEQTRLQKDRLDQIFQMLNIDRMDVPAAAIEGMVMQGKEMMAEDASPEAQDAGLIAAAQKIEHYEISGYGTAAHFAERLGHMEAAALLRQSLDEEKMADSKLNELAKNSVNLKAM